MAQWIIPQAEQIAMLASRVTDLTASTVHLLMASVPLTSGLTISALTPSEATFTGYSASTLAGPSGPFPDTVRQGVSLWIPTQNFAVGSTPTVTNSIYGFWIQKTVAGTYPILAYLFANPVPMVLPLAEINLTGFENYWGFAPPPTNSVVFYVNGQPT